MKVETESDIEKKEAKYIAEDYDNLRRKLRGELKKMKKTRKKSLAAAATLMKSVRSKNLKMLNKCKRGPNKMFDVICAKYGNEEDSDLTELLDDFAWEVKQFQ